MITKGSCDVKQRSLVDFVQGKVIGKLKKLDHFGEGSIATAARRAFLRSSGMSGQVKSELRKATVMAAEGHDGETIVQVLQLRSTDIEDFLTSGTIKLGELQKLISEQHATRKSLTIARKLWDRSKLRERIAQGSLNVKHFARPALEESRSLFD